MYFINKLSYIETNNSIRVSSIELFISFNEYLRKRVQNFSSSIINHKFLKTRYLVILRLTGFTRKLIPRINKINKIPNSR